MYCCTIIKRDATIYYCTLVDEPVMDKTISLWKTARKMKQKTRKSINEDRLFLYLRRSQECSYAVTS